MLYKLLDSKKMDIPFLNNLVGNNMLNLVEMAGSSFKYIVRKLLVDSILTLLDVFNGESGGRELIYCRNIVSMRNHKFL